MGENLRNKGHRERIREKFLSGDASSRSDEALLELLLTFAIPQRDVRPLAESLILQFGNLDNVLSANLNVLCQIEGLKKHSAVLLSLVEAIKNRTSSPHARNSSELHSVNRPSGPSGNQGVLSPLLESLQPNFEPTTSVKHRTAAPRRGSELFGKTLLKETIDILPRIPDSDDLDQTRAFLRTNLHFSAEQTRQRNTSYIVRRMFPQGIADSSLRQFAKSFAGTPELKEVAFYRFCKAEPLLPKIIDDLFLPSLGLGRIRRERLIDYLQQKFPESRSIADCVQGTIDALKAAGIASADRKQIFFSVRPIRIAPFAYILHAEFPEPGIYEVSKAETNRHFASLLWTPDKILAALYELRNLGVISKISEIDSFRQFTTKFELPEVVRRLAHDAKPS